MANLPINPFRLLQLAFLIILFSSFISVCGGRGPYADEDDAQPLVPSDGKGGLGTPQDHNNRGGSFGWWKKWTKCAYNVNNQCMAGPGEEQKVIRSYRILAFCAGGDNCDGAKLLFCYPSILDPSAFLDENVDDPDITPGRRAMAQISVINDEEHNITKTCAKLMEQCRKDGNCLGTLPEMAKKHGEEKWHGFLVSRVKDGFNIHMPFGKKGKRFHIPDDGSNAAETPHFYLNLGDKNSPIKTFVTRKSDGNLGSDKLTSDAALHKYADGSRQGIRLENAPGLWMLGLDILPDEDHQVLRLYTMGFPIGHKWTYCDRNVANDGLVIVSRNKTAYIDAWFLKPYMPDMPVPSRPIPQKTQDTIKLKDGIYTQPINTDQGFRRFFVHARVTDGTKSMSIKIMIGSLDEFKLTIFQFEYNKENGICTVHFRNEKQNCPNFQFDGARKSFWFFVDLDKGLVQMNCQKEFKFNGPLVLPIVEEAKFEITGEGVELFGLTPDNQAVLETKSTEYVDKPIFVDLPFQLDKLNILGNDTVYLLFASKMFNTSKFIHLKLIGHNSATNKNELLTEVIFLTKCPAKIGPTSNGDGKKTGKLVHCGSLECDGSCAGEFNLLMQVDHAEKRKKLYLNGKEAKLTMVNWDQIPQTPAPNFANPTKATPAAVPSKTSYSVYYAQIYGDLLLPVKMDVFKEANNLDIKFGNNAEKLSQYRYIIFHGMVFSEKGNFSVNYECKKECRFVKQNPLPNQPVIRLDVTNVLTLNFDLNSGIVEAIVPNTNDKTQNMTEKTPQNAFNLKMAQPFWIKIALEREGGSQQHHFYYRTYLNDHEKRVSNIFTDLITQGDDSHTFADHILFTDHNEGRTAVLLDNIVAMPFALKIVKAEPNVADDFTITTAFRLLNNGKIVQMFLASVSSTTRAKIDSILGIDSVHTMDFLIQSQFVDVYAHFLARFDQRSGLYKFCFATEFLFESGSGNQKNCDGNGMVHIEYDQNKKGNIVSMEIAVAKDGKIRVEINNEPRVIELKPNEPTMNAAKSTHFVISGDITLMDGPKQEKTAEQPKD